MIAITSMPQDRQLPSLGGHPFKREVISPQPRNHSGVMKTRREPILLLLDVVNITWMLAIFLQAYRGQKNNITNPWVMAPILACVLLHAIRWQKVAKLPYEGPRTSLADALNEAAKAFLGRMPYLVGPMPSKAALQAAADRHAGIWSASSPYTYGDLFCLLAREPKYRVLLAICLLTSGAGLYFGEGASYMPAILHWWPITSAMVVMVTGMGIYAGSILILLLQNKPRSPAC